MHRITITRDRNNKLTLTRHAVFDRAPVSHTASAHAEDYIVFSSDKGWVYNTTGDVADDDHVHLHTEHGPDNRVALVASKHITEFKPVYFRADSRYSKRPAERCPAHSSYTALFQLPAVATTPNPLRIVSYNIWNTNNIQGENYNRRFNRLVEQIRQADAEIIVLQEVARHVVMLWRLTIL